MDPIKPYEQKCLIVDWDALRDVFGEQYWNDSEGIRCIPTIDISQEQKSELWSRHDIPTESINQVNFLIAQL